MTALALALLLALSVPVDAPASERDRVPPCSRSGVDNPDGGLRDTRRDVRQLIRCAVRRWPVDGGAARAIAIAECESSLNPAAVGGTGNAHYGLFQQRDIYWQGRWEKWGKPVGVPNDPLDARANTIVSIRQAREVGWGPWECA